MVSSRFVNTRACLCFARHGVQGQSEKKKRVNGREGEMGPVASTRSTSCL